MDLIRWSTFCVSAGRSFAASVLLLVFGAVLAEQARGQHSLERFEYRQTRMGMAVRVVLYAPHDTTARRAGRAAFRLMEDLENVLSSYRSSSELSRLPRRAVHAPVRVSDPLFTVLRRAQRLARQSNGAFDVTVGPYMSLWDTARQRKELPDSATLQRTSARVGWQKMRLNESRRTVELTADSMQLNLGGIAKGYILDRALDTLSALGVSRAMIEAGGDLVVSDSPPNQAGWEVQLPAAVADGGPHTIHLTHAAVSTSGDTHQFVEIDGTRYSHIVNPKTGLGLTHHLLVTIVAEDGMTADGLATTVSLLGPEAGRSFLAEHYPDVTSYIRPSPTEAHQ